VRLTKEKLQKLILETLEETLITEEEIRELLAPRLNEGVLDVGRSLWAATKQVLDDMKDWAKEKIIAFVKKIGAKLIQFFQALRKKGLLKKYAARNEIDAVNILLTNKHIDLAVLIFTAIFKLAGGLAIEKLIDAPETLKKVLEILEKIRGGEVVSAMKELFGDLKDVKDMIIKAIEYSKDTRKTGVGFTALGGYEELGGLAEILNIKRI
jgi:hypothetical protein